MMRGVSHAKSIALHVVAVDGARARVNSTWLRAAAQESLLHFLICKILRTETIAPHGEIVRENMGRSSLRLRTMRPHIH
jgi:hypothetical protein